MTVNGVTLPDIPAEVLAEYPYAVITEMPSSYGIIYSLSVVNSPFAHGGSGLIDGVDEFYASHGVGMYYTCSTNAMDEWEAIDSEPWGPFVTIVGSQEVDGTTYETTLIWSNQESFDEILWFDEETGDFGTEPEEEYATRYSILGSILVGTARQIMRLTDSTEKVKPEEFEAKLESVEKGGGGGGFVVASMALGGVADAKLGYARSAVDMSGLGVKSSASGAVE